MKQKGEHVRETAQQPPNCGTCYQEIEGQSGCCCECVEDTNVTIPYGDGIDKEAQSNAKPEKRICGMPQPTKWDALPQDAQEVVQETECDPKESRTAQQECLLRDRGTHVSRTDAPAGCRLGVHRHPRRGGNLRFPLHEAPRRPD